jgi:hypothetical protein
MDLSVVKRVISKGALCKARKKLKYEAFVELNHHMHSFFYKEFSYLTWKGFNLIAIDGTTLRLPNTEEITQHFQPRQPTIQRSYPMAKASQMFDVLNKITIDAIISPMSRFDQKLAAEHFVNLLPQDLILMDRGYPSYWLFNSVLSMEANFCARVSSVWRIVREFSNSLKKETIITLHPTHSSKRQCVHRGLDREPLKLRLVRVELDTGEAEILITSLLDKRRYPQEIFSELYHQRWPVEEDYKTMKSRLEIENFSGKSVLSVYQDFHAKVFSKNLTSILAYPTRKVVEQNSQRRKYEYQINFTQALSKMKDAIVLLFSRPNSVVKMLLSGLHQIFLQTIEPIRPGRKYVRKLKSNRKRFRTCYKPIR